ncbi:hypothetical protein [Actinomadura livida]|uniref:Uncharacterized protein n=1 Tax=Actinomadura livida TaxID=79909 RepID=A0A7W7IHR0_9ACTN|nr:MULTISPECIES: hypothetical protein [Actinomadura]MBB4777324.1 hypothetical protein [Actinomadura catellatispora]GGU20047.1 hypothetical protein GCM10010208_51220 [Actinomadura livida]
MATAITFHGWQRPAVGRLIDTVEDGRARAEAAVRIESTDAAGAVTEASTARLRVLLAGPGDVGGLQPGAVTARFPAPGTADAETPKCPFAEFADPALPWRYTPQRTPANGERRLRPWLALLVGTDDEIVIAGRTARLSTSVLRAHRLGRTVLAAHVQDADGERLARVLSLRPLEPRTRYLAVLVPTFVVVDGELANAWSDATTGPLTLPQYAQWRFRTGPGGDFKTLATGLKPPREGDREEISIGRAPLRYPRLPSAPPLSVGGALAPADGAADEPLPAEIAADLARLRTPARDGNGRPIVGLPGYGAAWHPGRADETVWGAALNGDPRHRGVAGLGLRLGVELQEELADRAARQAGALSVAAERVRHLSLGLAASGALWRRRLPAEPNRRVWLLGPALRRVVTSSGPVAQRATAADRPLAPGWFATVTRRALRRGPARTAAADPAVVDPARLNPAANRPPPPVPFVEAGLPGFGERLGVPDFERLRGEVARGGAEQIATGALRGLVGSLDPAGFPRHRVRLEQLQATIAQRSAERDMPWVSVARLLAAAGAGESDPVFDEAEVAPLLEGLTESFETHCDHPPIIRSLMGELGDVREEPPPSRPLDLTRMAAELASAFDPTGPESPVRRRVLGTISGPVGDDPADPAGAVAPPEPCPDLDLPVWRRLSAMAPDWLLPGVGTLPEGTVIAVGTNPVFVDAFLTGFNTRVLEELRWRNLRAAGGCTPVRTFWFRADTTGGDRVDDIRGIRDWDDGTALGAAQHRPDAATGADLVLVFRSRLFQRYPNTLLYLVSARHGGGPPDFTVPPDPGAPRTLPTFQGRIGAGVTFFGFVGVPPEEITGRWVALEEPPAGYQFRNDVPDGEIDATGDGAELAVLAFDDPTRVLIQGDFLVPGGAR